MQPKQALMRNRKKTLFPTFLLNRLLFCVNFTFSKKCANSHHWVHLYRTTPTFFWTRNCPGIWMTRQKPNLWICNNQNTTLHCCKKKVYVKLCTARSKFIFTILDLFFCCWINQRKFFFRPMRGMRFFFGLYFLFELLLFGQTKIRAKLF